MKFSNFAAAMLFAAICALSTFGQNALELDRGVAAHKGIDAIYRQFTVAYGNLDADAAAALYTDGAAYLAPDAVVVEGRAEVRKVFADFFDAVRKDGASLKISFRIIQRRVSGDMAYDVGIYTLSQVADGKESSPARGKFVTVAIRDKKGIWRFQVDGYSGVPAPAK